MSPSDAPASPSAKNAFEAPSLHSAGGDADRHVYHPTLAVKRRARAQRGQPASGQWSVQGSSRAGLSLFGRRLGDGDYVCPAFA